METIIHLADTITSLIYAGGAVELVFIGAPGGAPFFCPRRGWVSCIRLVCIATSGCHFQKLKTSKACCYCWLSLLH